ncbi:Na+/H+ antiporter subunit E [Draconibacterium sp.]|nr:Na+/H+ antiporter subunit E [Draconibacterium sp.]
MLRKTFYVFQFIFYYLFQLIWSNIHIAFITLSPRLNIKYGFIKVPLNLKSDFGLLLFSNLVSMTPGSLVTDIDNARTMATVHVIFSNNENEIYDEVQKMQQKIKRFTA